MADKIGYFRDEIAAMDGYTPGEQPRDRCYIKLNTNENAYPPSPRVESCLAQFSASSLRLYPDPVCCELRETIAGLYGLSPNQVLVGNGSDDILTIAVRSFVPSGGRIICLEPSYSLYPVLAAIQGAECRKIKLSGLAADFAIEDIEAGELLLIPRPNAPTGTSFPLAAMRELVDEFPGIVLIDEAYAEFADDNCLGLLGEHPNLIISRTMSKSYSLAGIRLGYALAAEALVAGMLKVKDSYNVNSVSQALALAAFSDQDYFCGNIERIRSTRARLEEELKELSFEVLPSQANFVFASPPGGNAEELYMDLKARGILVRYFTGEFTGRFVRITIGTDDEIDALVEALREI